MKIRQQPRNTRLTLYVCAVGANIAALVVLLRGWLLERFSIREKELAIALTVLSVFAWALYFLSDNTRTR